MGSLFIRYIVVMNAYDQYVGARHDVKDGMYHVNLKRILI